MTGGRAVRTITLDEFHAEIRAQGTSRLEDVTFKCPSCGMLQSAQDLIDAGAGANLDEVERYLAFSCVGRFDSTKGCDWTLGGLLTIHRLEVVTPDGQHHPRFEPVPRTEDPAA